MPIPAERQSRAGPEVRLQAGWFECLAKHAKTLLDSGAPVVLAGDFNLFVVVLRLFRAIPKSHAVPSDY
jgi:exonuclease III